MLFDMVDEHVTFMHFMYKNGYLEALGENVVAPAGLDSSPEKIRLVH